MLKLHFWSWYHLWSAVFLSCSVFTFSNDRAVKQFLFIRFIYFFYFLSGSGYRSRRVSQESTLASNPVHFYQTSQCFSICFFFFASWRSYTSSIINKFEMCFCSFICRSVTEKTNTGVGSQTSLLSASQHAEGTGRSSFREAWDEELQEFNFFSR